MNKVSREHHYSLIQGKNKLLVAAAAALVAAAAALVAAEWALALEA
jgi:predicted nicotinamide N-methyase